MSTTPDPVAEYAATLGYKYNALYMGEHRERQEGRSVWVSDRWSVWFEKGRDRFETEMKMGTGLRKPDPLSRGKPGDWQYKPPRPRQPKAGEVLASCIQDAEYGQMSFSQFCDELGYDYNSREHEAVYRRCMDVGRELRQFFGADLKKIRDVIEGYEPE